jgi:hypothetical protein
MALVTGGTSGSGGLGSSVLLYDFTVAGADKASIDTGVDTPDAGSAGTSAFAALRMLEIFIIARTDNVASTSAVLTTLNNDSGANYDLVRLTGTTGSAPTAQAAASAAGTSMAFVAHGSGEAPATRPRSPSGYRPMRARRFSSRCCRFRAYLIRRRRPARRKSASIHGITLPQSRG